jgi:hypothetical protein
MAVAALSNGHREREYWGLLQSAAPYRDELVSHGKRTGNSVLRIWVARTPPLPSSAGEPQASRMAVNELWSITFRSARRGRPRIAAQSEPPKSLTPPGGPAPSVDKQRQQPKSQNCGHQTKAGRGDDGSAKTCPGLRLRGARTLQFLPDAQKQRTRQFYGRSTPPAALASLSFRDAAAEAPGQRNKARRRRSRCCQQPARAKTHHRPITPPIS